MVSSLAPAIRGRSRLVPIRAAIAQRVQQDKRLRIGRTPDAVSQPDPVDLDHAVIAHLSDNNSRNNSELSGGLGWRCVGRERDDRHREAVEFGRQRGGRAEQQQALPSLFERAGG
jgi:hypothetical protein